MRKIISLSLFLIMLFSCVAGTSVSYANNTSQQSAVATFESDKDTVKVNVKKPAKTIIKSVKPAHKYSYIVSWKKVKSANGYQMQFSTKSDFSKIYKKVTVKGKNKTKKRVYGFKENTGYYIRMRTYKLVDGKKIFSNWSYYHK